MVKEDAINLNQKSTQFTIVNADNTTMELKVKMDVRYNGIVNVNFNYAAPYAGQRKPYEVSDVIQVSTMLRYNLSTFVKINMDPFYYNISDERGEVVFSTQGE